MSLGTKITASWEFTLYSILFQKYTTIYLDNLLLEDAWIVSKIIVANNASMTIRACVLVNICAAYC